MSAPMPVNIVRPPVTGSSFAAKLVVGIAGVALSSWLVMLLLPEALPGFHPGFWRCVAGVYVVRIIWPTDMGYLLWTVAAVKKATKKVSR